MLVEDGRVVFRRPPAHPLTDAPSQVDLGGAYLLPGFIDAHCHILPTGLDLQKLDLSGCGSKEEVLDAVLQRHQSLAAGEWLLAVQYDQNRYQNGNHLSRAQLDAISAER